MQITCDRLQIPSPERFAYLWVHEGFRKHFCFSWFAHAGCLKSWGPNAWTLQLLQGAPFNGDPQRKIISGIPHLEAIESRIAVFFFSPEIPKYVGQSAHERKKTDSYCILYHDVNDLLIYFFLIVGRTFVSFSCSVLIHLWLLGYCAC